MFPFINKVGPTLEFSVNSHVPQTTSLKANKKHNMGDSRVPAVEKVVFDSSHVTIEQIGQLANKSAIAELSTNPSFMTKISKGPEIVTNLLNSGQIVYGVNTGYGDCCTVPVSNELLKELPKKLITYQGTGTGEYFNAEETRACLAARIISLARGSSGVRYELLAQLIKFLELDILPRIRKEGSVGASGDLTPLSYIAAAVFGEREVLYNGCVYPTMEVFKMVGMTPLELIPKEGLALINGTSVMTGVACLAWLRARQIARLATRLTSLGVQASNGNHFHFDKVLFDVKPHPGQMAVAARIREDLSRPDVGGKDVCKSGRIEDRYSQRCAPHVIGVLEDALPYFKMVIENELNSANDNPIIDVETKRVYHGAHFYGGHIAFAMDSIKCLVANVADLMDRQMAILVDPKFNNGLPANLSGAKGERMAINHGLKGLQISCSAWTAEALKQTMPASVFSRSTECHNQDKVSMGTIAARDCIRVIQLTEQVAAALMIAVRQGLELRRLQDGNDAILQEISPGAQDFVRKLNENVEFIEEDIYLDPIIQNLADGLSQMQWEQVYTK